MSGIFLFLFPQKIYLKFIIIISIIITRIDDLKSPFDFFMT